MTDPIENRIGAHCTKKEQQALYYELLPELPVAPAPVHDCSRIKLWEAQVGRCCVCGNPLVPHPHELPVSSRIRKWLATTREHVWPLALGYSDANNILLSHKLCNIVKGPSEPTVAQLDLLKKVYG